MNTPEWKKELDAVRNEVSTAFGYVTRLIEEERKIHISTTSPTNADGKDGDVWLIYEA